LDSKLDMRKRRVLESNPELTGTNTLSVVALAQKTVNTTDGEGETSLGRTPVREKLARLIDPESI
jgi:hypothetical protein